MAGGTTTNDVEVMAEAEAIVIGRHPHHEDDEDDNPNNRTIPPPPPARMTTAAAAEAPARDGRRRDVCPGRSAMQIYGLGMVYSLRRPKVQSFALRSPYYESGNNYLQYFLTTS